MNLWRCDYCGEMLKGGGYKFYGKNMCEKCRGEFLEKGLRLIDSYFGRDEDAVPDQGGTV